MPTSIASGTKTADGTEQDLTTDTSNKSYLLKVDLGNMVNGEEVELKVYTKCLTGGAERLTYDATYVNAQATPMARVECPEDIHIRCTLKQTAYVSAYKDFPWKLMDVGAGGELLEGSLTLAQVLRIGLAALSGLINVTDNGDGTWTIKVRDVADTKDRIVLVINSFKERLDSTLDGS
jgi:hypothetical protein